MFGKKKYTVAERKALLTKSNMYVQKSANAKSVMLRNKYKKLATYYYKKSLV